MNKEVILGGIFFLILTLGIYYIAHIQPDVITEEISITVGADVVKKCIDKGGSFFATTDNGFSEFRWKCTIAQHEIVY